MKVSKHTTRFLLFLLLPALLALSCNFPPLLDGAVALVPSPVVWRTATVPPFLLPTPAPEITPAAEGPPAQGGGGPMILPTASLPDPDNIPPILYYTQAGDTLPALAVRFGVPAEEITSPNPFPQTNLIDPNHLLLIPDRVGETTPSIRLLPDSEFVYSPSAITFDTEAFILEAGGYLAEYEEYLHVDRDDLRRGGHRAGGH